MRDDDLDLTLSRMLAAARADADPAALTRVRARLAARAARPGLVAWAMRPVAIGVSLALLVASAGLSLVLLASAPQGSSGEQTSLMDSLLEESGTRDAGTAPVRQPAGGVARDSGGAG